MELLSSTQVRSSNKVGAVEVTAVYDWSPLGDRGFLAFGALKWSEQAPTSPREKAFLYFDDEGVQKIFYRIAANNPVRWQYFNRDTPYIATIDETGYILFLDEQPVIREVTKIGGVRDLPFFPEDFRRRPSFTRNPNWVGYRRLTEFYRFIEKNTIVSPALFE